MRLTEGVICGQAAQSVSDNRTTPGKSGRTLAVHERLGVCALSASHRVCIQDVVPLSPDSKIRLFAYSLIVKKQLFLIGVC